ncbi:DUF3581 domain-containing protein [Pseudoalteromonas sp. SR44-5]|uniref:DUF3581 family protein n=1 Tax=unclassified Pseudoalteromonas TaxID=194690 RepID=UPI0016030FBD|nr:MULTISPECIES: DUF3581 family protein [unclassified Pseudoalteromonas]MBB1365024.1 DUF3581 domain-containing protein [Pseudoalteromonas sp. SR44-5]MBB1416567.1 DUF3581 domain-containing protein [Pseudoalteromonas sp. SG44-1]MBB1433275.1 DUF3581 domain-containing protein [Pseudoalteromonas sp. SG43-6]MBB1467070.1 DUF3581 domain-containing protein [Pseudoalteromonas sp. SG41-5]
MLSPFYQQHADYVSISREQGCRFAKCVADDYNPLHDKDAKRFCVPGDLLFSLVLSRYGISEKMEFTFAGMVDENTKLNFPEGADEFDITSGDKVMLKVKREGITSQCQTLTDSLIKNYVEFSGTTFPHVIIPLMGNQDVMINPARPMIIYESMLINLDTLEIHAPTLEYAEPSFEYTGKRGKITLRFNLLENGVKVGCGEKHMLVSGIQQYCQDTVDDLITFYNQRKETLKPA